MTYILFIMATVGVNARQYTETQPDSTYYSCALELILKRDYEKARSVLHQGLTFATGEMRIKSIQKAVISGRRHIVRYVRDFGRRKVFFLNRTTNFVWNCRWKMSEKQ